MDKHNPDFSALRVLKEHQWGYLDELQSLIDEKYISEFTSVGFISIGRTRTKRTWKLTELGGQYIEDLGI